MTEYREGQTATNPATGESLVFSQGQWVANPRTPKPTPKLTPSTERDLAKWREKAAVATANLARLDEFDRYNNTVRPSGGIVDNAYQSLRGFLGNSDITSFEALHADLARDARKVGEGATSDFDAKQFLKMTGGPKKPYRSNQAYSRMGRRAFEGILGDAEFYDEYAQQHGHLVGAFAARRKALKAKAPPSKRAKPAAVDDGWSIEEAGE